MDKSNIVYTRLDKSDVEKLNGVSKIKPVKVRTVFHENSTYFLPSSSNGENILYSAKIEMDTCLDLLSDSGIRKMIEAYDKLTLLTSPSTVIFFDTLVSSILRQEDYKSVRQIESIRDPISGIRLEVVTITVFNRDCIQSLKPVRGTRLVDRRYKSTIYSVMSHENLTYFLHNKEYNDNMLYSA